MVASLDLPRVRRAPALPASPLSVPIWPPGARAVEALTLRGCRWPIGEVADEAFRFCNAPRRRGSYCATHGRLACAGVAR